MVLRLRRLIFVLPLLSVFAACQQLENGQFQIALSPAGITSLKHVQDIFDTDYILGGRSLGDVLIRYRVPEEP